MADFYQHTCLPTLHHLAAPDLSSRAEELAELTRERPVAVLLPALFAETQRPALPAILGTLSEAPYVAEIVLSMNVMTAEQAAEATRLCRDWAGGKRLTLLWNDGPALQAAHERLTEVGCEGACTGKGANIWMGLAYLKAAGRASIVISHDTDILNYCPSLPARLCHPVAHPRMGYRFAKGYYSRVLDRLYGRVTRLLIFPLIQAFQDVLGPLPLLQHLESFRYPLSGEFAGEMEALAAFRLPPAWGLEVAMLAEAHRSLPVDAMCQVDLGIHYEHRHRQLQPQGLEPGLITAAADVARCLSWQILREINPANQSRLLRTAVERYTAHRAGEWMRRYEHVALLNGLVFHPEDESQAISAFTTALHELLHHVEAHGLHVAGMRPAPAEALAALPDLGPQILESAVEV